MLQKNKKDSCDAIRYGRTVPLQRKSLAVSISMRFFFGQQRKTGMAQRNPFQKEAEWQLLPFSMKTYIFEKNKVKSGCEPCGVGGYGEFRQGVE
ncbi:MAG: hypothetical protein IKL87_04665 [Oscillospiraceae bacterium]|nr:hypothetical protein [Oscillospiraceae bacterium]